MCFMTTTFRSLLNCSGVYVHVFSTDPVHVLLNLKTTSCACYVAIFNLSNLTGVDRCEHKKEE